MAYRILDISKYQPSVDYAKTAADCDGVILRAGLTYWGAQDMGKDPYFERHYKGFKAVGCPVGAYYYSAADTVERQKRKRTISCRSSRADSLSCRYILMWKTPSDRAVCPEHC